MKRIVVAGFSWLILLHTVTGGPIENAEARYQQVIDNLKKNAADVTTSALTEVETLADWKAVRAEKYRQFLYMLAQVSYYRRGTPIKPGPASRRHYKVVAPFSSDFTAGQAPFQSIPSIW